MGKAKGAGGVQISAKFSCLRLLSESVVSYQSQVATVARWQILNCSQT